MARKLPAFAGGAKAFPASIPIIKPTFANFAEMRAELENILNSGNVTNGRFVDEFERRAAEYLGVKYAVAVANATSGLMLAVKALGLKGKVIVPSFTFTATVHSLIWNNIEPVFVDCLPGSYSIDHRQIEKLLTEDTTGIMPVSIFGAPVEIEPIISIAKKHNLKVVFDSAQGFGAEYNGQKIGSYGDCEVFSLSPTKVLSAVEGGIVTTNNPKFAEYIKCARDYGKNAEDIDVVGLSARFSEINAYIGLKNLAIADMCISNRIDLINLYKKTLSDMPGVSFQYVRPQDKTSGNYMMIFIDKHEFGISRDELYEYLKAENIQTKKYFYPPVHKQKAYSSFGERFDVFLPVTVKASEEGLALPLYGHMHREAALKISEALRNIYLWCREKVADGKI